MSNVIDLTQENFNELVADVSKANPKQLMVVDFWATWCMPCKMLKPVFEKASEKYVDNPNVSFFSLEISEAADICTEYSVKGVPTIMFIKNGIRVDSLVGMQKQDAIETKITSLS